MSTTEELANKTYPLPSTPFLDIKHVDMQRKAFIAGYQKAMEEQKCQPTPISIDEIKVGDRILLTPKNEDLIVIIDKITDSVVHYHVLGREEVLSLIPKTFIKDSNLFRLPLPEAPYHETPTNRQI